MGHPGQGSLDRAAWTEQLGQGRWDKSEGTGQPEQIAWAVQLSLDRLAWSGLPRQADGTAQPG
jgi:hypothetical protein